MMRNSFHVGQWLQVLTLLQNLPVFAQSTEPSSCGIFGVVCLFCWFDLVFVFQHREDCVLFMLHSFYWQDSLFKCITLAYQEAILPFLYIIYAFKAFSHKLKFVVFALYLVKIASKFYYESFFNLQNFGHQIIYINYQISDFLGTLWLMISMSIALYVEQDLKHLKCVDLLYDTAYG